MKKYLIIFLQRDVQFTGILFVLLLWGSITWGIDFSRALKERCSVVVYSPALGLDTISADRFMRDDIVAGNLRYVELDGDKFSYREVEKNYKYISDNCNDRVNSLFNEFILILILTCIFFVIFATCCVIVFKGQEKINNKLDNKG